jgi:surface protein
MATAYALILNNGNNTYSMSFVKSDTTINVGDTYNSAAYGALPVAAVYTGFETADYTSASAAPWTSSYAAKITSVAVEDKISPLSMANWFYNASICTEMHVINLDTSNVTTMENTFRGCTSLVSLDVSDWDTKNVSSFMPLSTSVAL